MRRLVFIISLCVCFALSANGAGAENIARGVRVIVIDAGHGGPKFPGAHYRGIYEKDLNLKVALKLGALIERELPEVKVVYTRKTDKQFSESLTKDLQARADIANKAEGDLFFSIHTGQRLVESTRTGTPSRHPCVCHRPVQLHQPSDPGRHDGDGVYRFIHE